MPVVLVLRGERRSGFKIILDYMATYRAAWATKETKQRKQKNKAKINNSRTFLQFFSIFVVSRDQN